MSKTDGKREIEAWPIDKVKPYENNAKIHPPEQVAQLAASIGRLGMRPPILVEADGTIIAGHGRRLAAIELGWENVPVEVAYDLSKEEAQALRLADNRIQQNGEIDEDKMMAELQALADSGAIPLPELGFSDKELQFLVDTESLEDINIDALTDDIATAVDDQADENDRKSEEMKAGESRLGDLLGFNKVPSSADHTIASFRRVIESETGTTGADAFVKFAKSYLESVE